MHTSIQQITNVYYYNMAILRLRNAYLSMILNASSDPMVHSARMAAYVGAKWGSWPGPPAQVEKGRERERETKGGGKWYRFLQRFTTDFHGRSTNLTYYINNNNNGKHHMTQTHLQILPQVIDTWTRNPPHPWPYHWVWDSPVEPWSAESSSRATDDWHQDTRSSPTGVWYPSWGTGRVSLSWDGRLHQRRQWYHAGRSRWYGHCARPRTVHTGNMSQQ